jgi:uncharacterized protein YifE (UPF0438 family)
MEIPEDHLAFLSKTFYGLCFDLSCFTDKEKKLLVRQGQWMEALAEGKIKPYTAAQDHFVRVDRGEEAASTKLEIAWMKLKNQRAAEKAKGLTLEGVEGTNMERPRADYGAGTGLAVDAMWLNPGC